jgi:hypothetical protein
MSKINTYTIILRNLEGKRLLGRPRRRWKITAINLQEMWRMWIGFIRLRIGTIGWLL